LIRATSHHCALNTARVWTSDRMRVAFSGSSSVLIQNFKLKGEKTYKEQIQGGQRFPFKYYLCFEISQDSSDLSAAQFCLQIR